MARIHTYSGRNHDPATRLLAAITLRAVRDYFFEYRECSRDDLASAYRFCWSQAGLELIAYFTDMSVAQLRSYMMSVEAKKIARRVSNGPQRNGHKRKTLTRIA